MLELFPIPLTRDSFAEYGDVIDTGGKPPLEINEGTTQRFHDLAKIDVAENDGQALVSIFRGQPRPFPIDIRMVERHPLASQAFIPLQDRPWLIVVAAPGDNVGIAGLRAFRASGTQGINYRRGVWHHPLLVLKPDHDFLVIDRGGPGENCDEVWFEGETAHIAV